MAKKIKKVETPIDQRETFVSIQKNFADSDMSVEEKLKTLYALQEADSAIDKILQQRGELPVEVEKLENEVADLKAKATQINTDIDDANAKITDSKHKIVECDTAIERYKIQMESVVNSREFDSLSKEVENQDLLKKIAQKEVADTKDEILQKKAELVELKDEIAVRTEDLKAKKEELAHIVEATSKEEKTLRAKRDACAAKIDARTMSAYERIRSSENNHLAVVRVYYGANRTDDEGNVDLDGIKKGISDGKVRGACGGCFNTIILQRLLDIYSNKKLVICEHCGRIIVSDEIAGKA